MINYKRWVGKTKTKSSGHDQRRKTHLFDGSSTAATIEDRMFARAALLMPIVFATLFIFWLTSGLIGIFNFEKASLVLIDAGWNDEWAKASVIFWSFVDIAIALALIVRKSAYIACWVAVVVSVIYLISATLVVPHLWLDPLGL